ncbi:response regulator transcription factor [Paenarthrobacter sp. GOM3]|uniref:response regulator transcription factor n=1 Tax=Paenarthrobacter sp. GOM3 TaxID=2782567 RepID=UPI001BA67169|nr:response regulator transcription factor [Paenarthrobacter sp. GOM3]WOH18159.1 response regulator transcription factor [Paenarthrobacter sp. GOM3]
MIRTIIADDEELIRGALAALLSLEPDIEVVADVSNGVAAVSTAQVHGPDVVLLDLEMPELDGIEAAREIHSAGSGRAIIVTRHARPGTLKRALAANVSGFVPKSTPASKLATIIRSVADGERYIDVHLAAAALTEPESPLTARETDVLRLTHQGLATKQIAKGLGLAHGTVRNHLSSAMAKLHAATRTEAAVTAHRSGWI